MFTPVMGLMFPASILYSSTAIKMEMQKNTIYYQSISAKEKLIFMNIYLWKHMKEPHGRFNLEASYQKTKDVAQQISRPIQK